MLKSIKSFYTKNDSPTIITKWGDYLGELEYQKKLIKSRYSNDSPKQTTAIMFIKNILSQIDIDYLSTLHNDYDRYRYYFKPQSVIFNNLFDPVMTGRAYSNLFFNTTHKKTFEYVSPVDDTGHMFILPFNEEYHAWKEVEPITLWYNDSYEYSLNLLNDKITYKFSPPSFAIVFVDVITLGMKYYKYVKSDLPDKDIFEFIHNEVLYKLFDQLQDIYILNQFINALDSVYTGNPMSEVITDRQFGYTGQRQKDSLSQLLLKLNEVKSGKIRPGNIIRSKIFPSGATIQDKILHTFSHLDTFELSQYRYINLIRDIPYVDILLKLHMLRPTEVPAKNICKALRDELRILINNKITNRLNNSIVRNQIESYTNDLYEITKL